MSKRVLILPPNMTHTGRHQIREAPAGGYAKDDGTFTQAWEARSGLNFASFQDALTWAKAAPRRWTVLNESDPNLDSVRDMG